MGFVYDSRIHAHSIDSIIDKQRRKLSPRPLGGEVAVSAAGEGVLPVFLFHSFQRSALERNAATLRVFTLAVKRKRRDAERPTECSHAERRNKYYFC